MDLKPEVPAMGIMKMGNHNMYKIMCDCGCDEHDVVMDVDSDEFGQTITFYATTSTAYWLDRFGAGQEERPVVKQIKRFANEVYNRVGIAAAALFKGYVKTESTTILREQQVATLVALLEESFSKGTRGKS